MKCVVLYGSVCQCLKSLQVIFTILAQYVDPLKKKQTEQKHPSSTIENMTSNKERLSVLILTGGRENWRYLHGNDEDYPDPLIVT